MKAQISILSATIILPMDMEPMKKKSVKLKRIVCQSRKAEVYDRAVSKGANRHCLRPVVCNPSGE